MGTENIDDNTFKGVTPEGEEASLFRIFDGEKPAPPAPPIYPRASAGPQKPPAPDAFQQERLRRMGASPEAVLRGAGPVNSAKDMTDILQKKIMELEGKLLETQEKALAASLELKNKDELQRQAMQQAEDMFRSLRDNQRASETQKKLEEKIEHLEQFISGLQAKLTDDGARQAEKATALEAEKRSAQKMIHLEKAAANLEIRLQEAISREKKLKSEVETQKNLGAKVNLLERLVLGFEKRLTGKGPVAPSAAGQGQGVLRDEAAEQFKRLSGAMAARLEEMKELEKMYKAQTVASKELEEKVGYLEKLNEKFRMLLKRKNERPAVKIPITRVNDLSASERLSRAQGLIEKKEHAAAFKDIGEAIGAVSASAALSVKQDVGDAPAKENFPSVSDQAFPDRPRGSGREFYSDMVSLLAKLTSFKI